MKQIKKIIILTASIFNQRDFKRFGIEVLIKNNFDVEVWDLSNILHPGVTKNYIPPDPIDWLGCKKFTDKKHVLNKLKALKSDTFLIVLLHYFLRYHFIYKAISDSDAQYTRLMTNALPFSDSNRKRENKLKKILSGFKKSPKALGRALLNRSFDSIPFRYVGIKPISLIFAGTSRSIHYSVPINNSTEIIWIHTFDYDLYLEERNKPSIERPIAVFLDEYMPFHVDRFYTDLGRTISADEYYASLNKFFKLVEDQLGLAVVIAAHPRSHYKSQPDYFEGRKCIRGETIRLIKESQLVLSHSSTAVNFANLFYKPLIFLTSFEIDKSFQGHHVRIMAKCYGKEPIFIDRNSNIDWGFELKINKPYYEGYRENYIKKKNTEDLPFWQVVANRLKQGIQV